MCWVLGAVQLKKLNLKSLFTLLSSCTHCYSRPCRPCSLPSTPPRTGRRPREGNLYKNCPLSLCVQSRSLPSLFFQMHRTTIEPPVLFRCAYCFLALKYRTMEHGKRKRTAFDQERETGTNHKTKKGQSTDQGKNTKCTNGTSELNRTPQDTRATYHCCPE